MNDKEIQEAFENKFDKKFVEWLKSEHGENVFSEWQDYEINRDAITFNAGINIGEKHMLEKFTKKLIGRLNDFYEDDCGYIVEDIQEFIDTELEGE